MMTSHEFLLNLATVDFAGEYYAFCSAFRSSLPFTKARPRRAEIAACLAQLGHDLTRDTADGAYVARARHGGHEISHGFAFQTTGAFEGFFGWRESDDVYVGGNFCAIAEQVLLLTGAERHDPPYPRPYYCGPERLFELIERWDRLYTKLCGAAGLR